MALTFLDSSGRRAAAALALMTVLGCATRSVPLVQPHTSAAAPDSEPAPRRPVATMLREDPPLPGDESAAWDLWPGLEREATAPAHGDHSRHDHPTVNGRPEAGSGPDSRAPPEPPPGDHTEGGGHHHDH